MVDRGEEIKAGPVSRIEIANNDEGATGIEVAGRFPFVNNVLQKLMKHLGRNASLRDIAGLAEPGTTASSDNK